ncbi:glycoside hydrolase [bacterium]|nr:glycoside hydrolase [bacterium]
MKMRFCLAALAAAALLPAGMRAAESGPAAQVQITPLRLDRSRPARYARSFRTPDGDIHLLGFFKITDRGSRVVVRADSEPPWLPTDLNEAKINTFFYRPGLFLGLMNKVETDTGGTYAGRIWRSTDELKTLREEKTLLVIPEAGRVDFGTPELWAGLFFHRGVVELKDGSLLAAMYGNFEADSIAPTNPQSKIESKFKLRTFVARSTDNGSTWRYLSSVAVPERAHPDDSEGYNEWSIVRLEDGRLLGIIRTGHFTPLVAVWSADEGRSWSEPRVPEGLGPAGVDPNLLRLADGRLALAFGEMAQPPDSVDREQYWRNFSSGDHRRRCRLALSRDKTGESWQTIDISDLGDRSAYGTIYEVAPDTLLYQSDLELWRIGLPPQ